MSVEARWGGVAGDARTADGLPSAVSGLRQKSLVAWVLRLVERVHQASRSVVAMSADYAVLVVAAKLAGVHAYPGLAISLVIVIAFNLARVYSPRSTLETQGLLWYPSRIAAPFAIVALAWAAQAHRLPPPRVPSERFAIYGFAGLTLMRLFTWAVLFVARRRGHGLVPTIVVGQGPTASTVISKLTANPEAGLNPVGILSPDGSYGPGEGIATGRAISDLPSMVREAGVGHIVLVPEGDHDVAMSECLEFCDGLDVSFSILPPLSEMFLQPSLVTQVGGLPLIPLGKVSRSRGSLPGKRVFDFVGGVACMILLSPLLVITAVVVKLWDRGPVFYRQPRVGHGGRVFDMFKFRSMVVGADEGGHTHLMTEHSLATLNAADGLLFKVRDDPRVTPVGRVIRRLSIDELPQIWNVIRGDMSLVGPRPLAVDADAFGPMDGKRHNVRPGITGYWQIAGGNGLTYAEMVKLDLAYIQNWSLWLDMRLLVRTVPALIHRRGPW